MKFTKFDYSSVTGGKSDKEIVHAVQRYVKTTSTVRDVDVSPLVAFRWIANKKPFYRLYPGVLEAFVSWTWTEAEAIQIKDKLPVVAIELPEDSRVEFTAENEKFTLLSILCCTVCQNCHAVMAYVLDSHGSHANVLFFSASIHEIASTSPTEIASIVFGVLSICDNPDLMRPIVLAADREKYDRTHDKKYVDKAVRLGVNGFDIGKDIPTREEMRRMKEENEQFRQAGKKCPHMRCAHLRRQLTGKGRTMPKIVVIKQTFVNWDVVRNVPQGYYE